MTNASKNFLHLGKEIGEVRREVIDEESWSFVQFKLAKEQAKHHWSKDALVASKFGDD